MKNILIIKTGEVILSVDEENIIVDKIKHLIGKSAKINTNLRNFDDVLKKYYEMFSFDWTHEYEDSSYLQVDGIIFINKAPLSGTFLDMYNICKKLNIPIRKINARKLT